MIDIAKISVKFIKKELIRLNNSTLLEAIKAISHICVLPFPETEKIISNLIEDNHILHTFSCVLGKVDLILKETCLFMLSNIARNSP